MSLPNKGRLKGRPKPLYSVFTLFIGMGVPFQVLAEETGFGQTFTLLTSFLSLLQYGGRAVAWAAFGEAREKRR